MNMWKGMNVGIGGGHGDGRDGPFDDEWERRSENFARRMQGTIAPPRRLTTLYHLATMGAQRAWNPTDLSNAYHWFKYELGKTIRAPVHIPKPFGYDAPYNPMENYDESVKMENLRILTRIHQDDDCYFPDAYAAAVTNHNPPRRDGRDGGNNFHILQGKLFIIMK